jgi:hypothetical protein
MNSHRTSSSASFLRLLDQHRTKQLPTTLICAIIVLSLLLSSSSIVSSSPTSYAQGCYGIAVQYSKTLGCETTTLSGLKFCSFMNNQTTDAAFNTYKLNVTGIEIPYAQFYDQLLEDTFKSFVKYLTRKQAAVNGTVCESCVDKLKMLMCANSFPASGLRSCFANQVMSKFADIEKICPEFCGCPEDGLCMINRKGEFCGLHFPKRPRAWLCLLRNIPDVVQTLKSCNYHFTPVSACIDTLSTCGCLDPSNVETLCNLFFVPDGQRTVNFTTEETCSSSKGWCKNNNNSKARALIRGDVTAAETKEERNIRVKQLVCPNDQICIANPTPLSAPTLMNPMSVVPRQVNEILATMVCGTSEYEECFEGCTNYEAYAFDPKAKIDDNKQKRQDPLLWMTWTRRNVTWIVILLIILLIVMTTLLIVVLSLGIYFMFRAAAQRRKDQIAVVDPPHELAPHHYMRRQRLSQD